MNIIELVKGSKVFDSFWLKHGQLRELDEEREKLINMHPKQFISNVNIPVYKLVYTYETKRKTRKGEEKIRKHQGEVIVFDNNLPDNPYEAEIMLQCRLDEYIAKWNVRNRYSERLNAQILDFSEYGTLRPLYD